MNDIIADPSAPTNPTARDWLLNYAGDSDWRTQVDRVLTQHRAEVLAEDAHSTAVHVFDAVYNALVSYSVTSHAFPGLQYAHLRDELAQYLTTSLLEAGIGGDTIVCDAEGCALPCTPGCQNQAAGGAR